MHEHTFGTLLSTDPTPGTNTSPLPPASIAWSQTNPWQTYATIPTEEFDTGWTIPPPVETLVAAGHMHGSSHENSGSQDSFALEMAMAGLPAVPLAAPAPTCGLNGGLPCALPLDGSVSSIQMHLRLHGHRYPPRQTVLCPWMGCFDTLQWANIPRHIQSIHLGIRFRCFNCGKPYTRAEGLARHIASLKCNGATDATE